MRAQVLAASVFLLLSAACSDPGRVGRSRPAIAADLLAVDFGAVKTDTSRTLPVVLTNEGTASLTFLGSSFRGDVRGVFSVGALPSQLAPGEKATVELTYAAPRIEGLDGAQWIVLSDANNSPELAISLSGRADRACAAGLTQCNGECVDLQADPSHCGSCDVTCTLPETCLSGACGCIAKTCKDVGECGAAADGCGGTLSCGACSGQFRCVDNRCIPPTCSDAVQNQGETDVDCGGPCQRCAVGKACNDRSDCTVGLACVAGQCGPCSANDQCASDQVCRGGTCGACNDRVECGGGRACIAGRCLSCVSNPPEAAFNECGLCGGPPVSGVGSSCVLPNDCPSTYACTQDQLGVACVPRTKNACDLCDGPTVTGLGDSCPAPVSGCDSALACNVSNTGTVCAEVPRNACGLCAGPAINGLGDACTLANGCSSTKVCDAQQSGVTCAPVVKNACDVCGGVPVSGVGVPCTLPNGCTSTLACNAAGDGTVCTDVKQNACGVCGAAEPTPPTGTPTSSWVKDAACTGASGCPGKLVCDAAGTNFECNAPATCDIAQHVVISQVCGFGPNGAYDDFIELYNPTDNWVDLAGYTLWYRADTNTSNWVSNVVIPAAPPSDPLKSSIPPKGYFLGVFAGSGANYSFGTASTGVSWNFTYTSFNLARDSGQLLLWKDNSSPPAGNPTGSEPKYLDAMGYGANARWSENAVAGSGLVDGESLLRKPFRAATPSSLHATTGADRTKGNGMDTNDNSADFVRMPARTFRPRNSSVIATP